MIVNHTTFLTRGLKNLIGTTRDCFGVQFCELTQSLEGALARFFFRQVDDVLNQDQMPRFLAYTAGWAAFKIL
ncbi:MAG: hypothetical protein ACI97A_003374 [Planctomycetota bacterium]